MNSIIQAAVAAVEGSAIAEWLRASLLALPVINAVHVIGVALLFGTIAIVDLRLLGIPGVQRSFRRTGHELLGMTWLGFALAFVTGLLMFAANATTYMSNAQFFWKMGLLVLAGLNMLWFELVTSRTSLQWDTTPTPPAARAAGVLSLLLWTAVIVFGRWIGFTKGYNFEVPTDMELDFDFSALDALGTLGAWLA
jgi:hypothetical protein